MVRNENQVLDKNNNKGTHWKIEIESLLQQKIIAETCSVLAGPNIVAVSDGDHEE